ncbi:hypothetical protein QBC39DRAFT_162974 [Podospora conica]|nr:hypothetical protein QBC39DRAFT_162974 [Schizothecium conicum]
MPALEPRVLAVGVLCLLGPCILALVAAAYLKLEAVNLGAVKALLAVGAFQPSIELNLMSSPFSRRPLAGAVLEESLLWSSVGSRESNGCWSRGLVIVESVQPASRILDLRTRISTTPPMTLRMCCDDDQEVADSTIPISLLADDNLDLHGWSKPHVPLLTRLQVKGTRDHLSTTTHGFSRQGLEPCLELGDVFFETCGGWCCRCSGKLMCSPYRSLGPGIGLVLQPMSCRS